MPSLRNHDPGTPRMPLPKNVESRLAMMWKTSFSTQKIGQLGLSDSLEFLPKHSETSQNTITRLI